MNSPKLQRFRGRTVISATAIALADGRFRPEAVIQTNHVDNVAAELVPFDGPLFDSYFDAAQYALETTDEMHVQLQRVRHAASRGQQIDLHEPGYRARSPGALQTGVFAGR